MLNFILVNGLTRRSEIRIVISEHASVFFKSRAHARDTLVGINAFHGGVAMDNGGPILCGKCHVTPERGLERDGEVWAACPVCGQEDRLVEIEREAIEYKIGKLVGKVPTFKSSSVTVKGPPQREYRWVTSD
jgi:hypothetical protein